RHLHLPLLADDARTGFEAGTPAVPRDPPRRLRDGREGGRRMTRIWLLVFGVIATIGFATIVLVVVPDLVLVNVPVPAELAPYSPSEARGRQVYIANGCIYCHSQQL